MREGQGRGTLAYAFKRKDKVGAFIQEEMSMLLQRELTDPRIGFVTVTRVEVTDDLRLARIFVSVYGSPEEQASSMEGLNSAKGFVRRMIGESLNIRFVPQMEFVKDDSLEKSIKVMTLLNEIKEGEEKQKPVKTIKVVREPKKKSPKKRSK